MFASSLARTEAATPIIDVPASYFTDSNKGFDEAHGNGMVGFVFRLTSTVTITQIGWYDAGGDGLGRSIQVGLWQDPSGGNFSPSQTATSLLGASGIQIPAGTAASLNGVYRVIDLASPLILGPGTYQIGGLDTSTTTDPIRYMFEGNVGPLFNLPGVTYGQFFYAQTAPGSFHAVNSNQMYLAPGLELGPMIFAVPEASTVSLAAGGIFLLAARRRRGRRY